VAGDTSRHRNSRASPSMGAATKSVLKNENGVAILPAVSAWKIDDKQMKFVELKTEGFRCSRDE
jgi:hypothetical protein